MWVWTPWVYPLKLNPLTELRGCWLTAVRNAALKNIVDLSASQWACGTSKRHKPFSQGAATLRDSQRKTSSNILTGNQRRKWEAEANKKQTWYQQRQALTLVKTGRWRIFCSVFGCEENRRSSRRDVVMRFGLLVH